MGFMSFKIIHSNFQSISFLDDLIESLNRLRLLHAEYVAGPKRDNSLLSAGHPSLLALPVGSGRTSGADYQSDDVILLWLLLL